MHAHLPILLYHSISNTTSKRFRRFAVPPALFQQHLEFLHEKKFKTYTVTQLVHAVSLKKIDLAERIAVLTFDDGFSDFFTEAFPVLKHFDFTATLYVTTEFIGGTSRWLEREGEADRAMLKWAELAEISDSGIECAAHGHSHRPLDSMSARAANDEITLPREILSSQLDRKIESFAYPFGYYTQSLRGMVRAAGYSSACAVKYTASSVDDDSLALSRLFVGPDTYVRDFAALVNRPSSRSQALYSLRSHVWRKLRTLVPTKMRSSE
jgi:peptidoglycan/xylan/chitin deacetylase (PgdA/CDA1 family)